MTQYNKLYINTKNQTLIDIRLAEFTFYIPLNTK